MAIGFSVLGFGIWFGVFLTLIVCGCCYILVHLVFVWCVLEIAVWFRWLLFGLVGCGLLLVWL